MAISSLRLSAAACLEASWNLPLEQAPHPDLDAGRLLYVGIALRYMADNARVCWMEQGQPWELESQPISQLDLPVNLTRS
ncbi:hypothetical protein [Streptomyces sp. NPDC001020]